MEDKLQTFRQPMVTATGIILGFVLNFVASWVKTDSPVGDGLAFFGVFMDMFVHFMAA